MLCDSFILKGASKLQQPGEMETDKYLLQWEGDDAPQGVHKSACKADVQSLDMTPVTARSMLKRARAVHRELSTESTPEPIQEATAPPPVHDNPIKKRTLDGKQACDNAYSALHLMGIAMSDAFGCSLLLEEELFCMIQDYLHTQ